MSIAEYQKIAVPDFGGQNTRLDPTNVPITQALTALNCEFNPQQVSKRLGFSSSFPLMGNFYSGLGIANNPMHHMVNWVSTSGSHIIWFRRRGLSSTSIAPAYLITNLATGTGGFSAPDADTLGMSVAPSSTIVYIAGFKIDVNTHVVSGADSGYALTPTTGEDRLFLGPEGAAPALSSTNGGFTITPGLHRVGYIVQTRAGFLTQISPVDSATGLFNVGSVITTIAGDRIDEIVAPGWPNEASLVYPVMTTVDNLDRYFIVPGVAPGVITSSGDSFTFHLDISDADLVSVGTDVTANQFLLTRSVADVAPFFPFGIYNFGSRVVYLTIIGGIAQAFVSEPDSGQQITADQNIIFLPGQQMMRAAGTVGRILYICGPHNTYSYEDTGEVPVLWPPPRLVDGSIGTLSPYGFTVDATTGTGWCADTTGLYDFEGGVYAEFPVSYYNDYDWKRINWFNGQYDNTLPTVGTWPAEPVKVIDDKDKKRVCVIAPLNINATVNISGTAVTWVSGDQFPVGLPINSTSTKAVIEIGSGFTGVFYTIASITSATSLTLGSSAGTQTGVVATILPVAPTDIMVFDYSNGKGFEQVKYSRWNLKFWSPGAGCIVQNPATGINEFWIGSWDSSTSAAGAPFSMRQSQLRDTSYTISIPPAAIYSDNALGIDWRWESSLLPGMQINAGPVYYHYAQQIRTTGAGTLLRTIYGLDRTKSVALSNLTLSTAPGQAYTNRYARLRSEGASYLFSNNTANEYCILSALDHFFAPGPSYR